MRPTLCLLVVALAVGGCAGHGTGTSRGTTPATTASVVADAAPATPLASLASLHVGWNDVPGPPETRCAGDSPFRIVVRPGAPDRVLVFLNGGGACWRAAECDPRGRTTYTTRADTANDPRAAGGIFALDNPANPLRDFTMVFVPYCTADVHLGSRTVVYERAGFASGDTLPHSFTIRHQGAANADWAIAWTRAHIANPSVVVVVGSSAGAIASPVYASILARSFPNARVVQLGDAAGGYHTPSTPQLLAGWGATDYLRRHPAFGALDSAAFSFEALYTAAAHATPRVTFAQYNAVDDAVQLYFLSLLGVRGVPLASYLALGLNEIRAANPAFRSYTAPGRVHTILRLDAVYSTVVDGVAFRDWLADLVQGRPVHDVGTSLLSR